MISKLDKLVDGVQVLGLMCNQWGDTGKGKFSEYFAHYWADVDARGTGGDNAGHTVVIGGKKIVLHLVPCGILNPNVYNIIGNGVVFNPKTFLKEIAMLTKEGVSLERLYVSGEAHVITPLQIICDTLENMVSGIGTTGRGIGPTYADKARRMGIRINDLFNEDFLANRLRKLFRFYGTVFGFHFSKSDEEIADIVKDSPVSEFFIGNNELRLDYMFTKLKEYGEKIKPFVRDTRDFMHRALANKKKILLEGAQGNLLGINTGTYPYVTSSDANSNGTLEGVGLPGSLGNRLKIYGIMKFPILTRVGYGPMPTEIGTDENDNEFDIEKKYDKNELREKALAGDAHALRVYLRLERGEYGATTGRPRRPGLPDFVALRHSFKANGNRLILTKVDKCPLPEIEVCHEYEYDGPRIEANGQVYEKGKPVTVFPTDSYILENCRPKYEKREWCEEDISGARTWEELPEQIQKVIREDVELKAGGVAEVISVGAEREQTIIR